MQKVRGIWSIGSYWPGSIPEIRRAMAELTTRPPGAVATFNVTAKSATPNDPRPGTWTHQIRVIGSETVSVPAVIFQTVVLEDQEQATSGNGYQGINRLWVDPALGTIIQAQSTGLTNGKNSQWVTTSLQRP